MSRTAEAYISIVESLIQSEISKYEDGTFSDMDIEWIMDNAITYTLESATLNWVDVRSKVVSLVNEMY